MWEVVYQRDRKGIIHRSKIYATGPEILLHPNTWFDGSSFYGILFVLDMKATTIPLYRFPLILPNLDVLFFGFLAWKQTPNESTNYTIRMRLVEYPKNSLNPLSASPRISEFSDKGSGIAIPYTLTH